MNSFGFPLFTSVPCADEGSLVSPFPTDVLSALPLAFHAGWASSTILASPGGRGRALPISAGAVSRGRSGQAHTRLTSFPPVSALLKPFVMNRCEMSPSVFSASTKEILFSSLILKIWEIN